MSEIGIFLVFPRIGNRNAETNITIKLILLNSTRIFGERFTIEKIEYTVGIIELLVTAETGRILK
ncbi:MAG: hypothetical protein M1477_04985 [Candidatus Thermoplasmatota archaeon]|nr:hypothetical protein [Candidatus Thermoplasmatota archaeon]